MAYNATTASVFGIPPYAFFSGIGMLFSFIALNVLLLKSRLDINKCNIVVAVSLLPMLLGAKLLGVLYNIASNLHYCKQINCNTFYYSGIVFYGGLISFLISIYVISKKFIPSERDKLFSCLAVSIPLFHFFGRIGCFTAGCCYGIAVKTPISVLYTTYTATGINTEWRIPIQFIESGLNLLLFVFLLICFYNKWFNKSLLSLYLIIYSVERIAIECFRGDWDRELYFGVSASQIIGVVIIFLVVSRLLTNKRRFVN